MSQWVYIHGRMDVNVYGLPGRLRPSWSNLEQSDMVCGDFSAILRVEHVVEDKYV